MLKILQGMQAMQKQLMEDREEDRGGEKAAEFVRGADHRTHRPQRLAIAH